MRILPLFVGAMQHGWQHEGEGGSNNKGGRRTHRGLAEALHLVPASGVGQHDGSLVLEGNVVLQNRVKKQAIAHSR